MRMDYSWENVMSYMVLEFRVLIDHCVTSSSLRL